MTTATKTKKKPATKKSPDKKANGKPAETPDYKSGIAADLAQERRYHRDCVHHWSNAKQDVKDWKTEMDASQIRINALSDDLAALEDGTYQPKLFDRNGHANTNGATHNGNGKVEKGPQPVDAGAAMHIAALAQFGLTENQCKKLVESELEIRTIGKLEKLMREDEWWMRKIKGVGTDTTDKITDALLAFRKKHPVPSADEPEAPKDTTAAQTAEQKPEATSPVPE